MTTTEPTQMLDHARRYHEAGLAVMPPKQDGSKRPYPGSWTEYQQRTPTPSELRGWYRAGSLTGIGAICGAISGNLELFEFDCFETYLAFGELAEATGLQELVHRVRDGYSERTPGGGIHWYYRCETIEGNTKLASRPKTADEMEHQRDKVKVLIETRGEGGYSVMAPSWGPVHPSGKAYEVLAGAVEDITVITPDERQMLWQLARCFDQTPERTVEAEPAPNGGVVGDRPGDLYSAQVSWQEVLEPHGWRAVYRRNQTTYWRRPGKNVGISASTNHSGNDTLMVFSTSTDFDIVPASYSKFAAYTLLEHGGDYAQAGRALWTKGFRGAQSTPKGVKATVRDWTSAPTSTPTSLSMEADPETGELPGALADGRVDLWKYISGGIPEPKWLQEGVLLPGMVELFHGEPGCGKTILALAYTRNLVREGHSVLFIDEESGPTMTAGRLSLMGITEDEASRIHYYPFTGITLEDADELLNTVLEHRPAMVIFDSMADVLTASHLSEDAASDVTNWMVNVAVRLARSPAEPCVVILDHNTKDAANTKYARGSGAKKAKADIAWLVEKKQEFDSVTLGRVALERTKNRPGFMPESVTYVVGGRGGELVVERFDPSQHGMTTWPEGSYKLWRWLLEQDGVGLTGEAARALSVERQTIGQWSQFLLGRELVKRIGQARLAGFEVTETGWQIVRSDDADRQTDDAQSSGESSDLAPLLRGHLTISDMGDEASIHSLLEEDPDW